MNRGIDGRDEGKKKKRRKPLNREAGSSHGISPIMAEREGGGKV